VAAIDPYGDNTASRVPVANPWGKGDLEGNFRRTGDASDRRTVSADMADRQDNRAMKDQKRGREGPGEIGGIAYFRLSSLPSGGRATSREDLSLHPGAC
jgi:hypothetical protein